MMMEFFFYATEVNETRNIMLVCQSRKEEKKKIYNNSQFVALNMHMMMQNRSRQVSKHNFFT